MGGKTVALKSLCLCQYLFQFGFAVPAERAEMVPVENIVFCFETIRPAEGLLLCKEILRIGFDDCNGGERCQNACSC